MIDVSGKNKTQRLAEARAFVKLNSEIIEKIKNNDIPKGNVLECARIAGIFAAKNTANLIPLCHNIELEYVNVGFNFDKDGIIVKSSVKSTGKTGVEMEAMTACAIAALAIYDMCKMFSKSIEIQDMYLVEKRGGRSGVYVRSAKNQVGRDFFNKL